jgi:hypothetical protein
MGDHVDIYRAVHRAIYRVIYRAICRAICRDNYTVINYIGGYTADCRTFLVY